MINSALISAPGMESSLNELLQDKRVLLVDDDSISRFTLAALLKKLGLTTTCVSSGHEALERCRTQTFDLIFMDLMMPDLDGCGTAQALYQQQRASGTQITPVIVLSASPEEIHEQALLHTGIEACMHKPVDFRLLSAMLFDLLITHHAEHRFAQDPSTNGLLNQYLQQLDADDRAFVVAFMHSLAADIQVEAALERLSGNMDLYLHLLYRFYLRYVDHLFEINTLLEKRDFLTATRKAHSLKGLSANLGAVSVSELAGKVEQACRERSICADDIRLILLNQQLAGLVQMLSAIEQRPHSRQRQTLNEPPLEAILEQLEPLVALIQQDYGHCLQQVESLHAQLSEQHRLRQEISLLLNQLREFDMHKAEKYLKALIQRLSQNRSDAHEQQQTAYSGRR